MDKSKGGKCCCHHSHAGMTTANQNPTDAPEENCTRIKSCASESNTAMAPVPQLEPYAPLAKAEWISLPTQVALKSALEARLLSQLSDPPEKIPI